VAYGVRHSGVLASGALKLIRRRSRVREDERAHRVRGETESARSGLLDGVPAGVGSLLAVDAGDVAEEMPEEVDVVHEVDQLHSWDNVGV
jgi:hypothetical protein